MKFSGENLSKGKRVQNSPVKVIRSARPDAARHFKHHQYQQSLRQRRERIKMQLLTNQPKLNEGRGRSATASVFHTQRLIDFLEVDDLEEAVRTILSQGSPMIQAIEGEDYEGTKSGALRNLKAQIDALDGPYGVGVRQVKGNQLWFTFKTVVEDANQGNEEE